MWANLQLVRFLLKNKQKPVPQARRMKVPGSGEESVAWGASRVMPPLPKLKKAVVTMLKGAKAAETVPCGADEILRPIVSRPFRKLHFTPTGSITNRPQDFICSTNEA